jgi:hypothetical protein
MMSSFKQPQPVLLYSGESKQEVGLPECPSVFNRSSNLAELDGSPSS